MSGICNPENNHFIPQEIEYLAKLDWLWQNLSLPQKSKIVRSVTDGSLRQGSDKHCFIAEAISASRIKSFFHNDSFVKKVLGLVRGIFYEGPSFEFLLEKKISNYDRKILDDIYYARIGNKEHQYQRATELARLYVSNLLITV